MAGILGAAAAHIHRRDALRTLHDAAVPRAVCRGAHGGWGGGRGPGRQPRAVELPRRPAGLLAILISLPKKQIPDFELFYDLFLAELADLTWAPQCHAAANLQLQLAAAARVWTFP